MTTPEPPSTGPAGSPPVEVRRSKKRRRTVQAYMRDDTIVVLLPARMTKAEEKFWVAEMVGRLERQEQRRERRRNRTDSDLLTRANDLSSRYLDGRAQPAEVRWVDNQNDRWGSCTPSQGSIRLSDRLRDFPVWVSDYVLLHELTHLLEPGHGPEFWQLVNRYPKTERARGYLEGVLAISPDPTPANEAGTTDTDDGVDIDGDGARDGAGSDTVGEPVGEGLADDVTTPAAGNGAGGTRPGGDGAERQPALPTPAEMPWVADPQAVSERAPSSGAASSSPRTSAAGDPGQPALSPAVDGTAKEPPPVDGAEVDRPPVDGAEVDLPPVEDVVVDRSPVGGTEVDRPVDGAVVDLPPADGGEGEPEQDALW